MKSSDESFSTLDTTFNVENIEIPEEVREQLKATLHKLAHVFEDDRDFYKQVVEKCLLVGSGVKPRIDSDDVIYFLWSKYPDIKGDKDTEHLLWDVHSLGDLLCLRSPLLSPMILPFTYEKYYSIRKEIVSIVHDVLDSAEIIAPNILGDINETYQ